MKLQGHALKNNSMRFAVALLGALASFIAGTNAALAASPQHHDQRHHITFMEWPLQ
jgi:hypothetical protein